MEETKTDENKVPDFNDIFSGNVEKQLKIANMYKDKMTLLEKIR